MLKKLLKYDLKWSLKLITIYLSIGLVAAIIGRLLDLFPNSLFFSISAAICKGASLSLGVTGLINAIIRAWVRVINNMYKDEAYLTHTLPISIDKHYLSKILSTIIVIVICILSILVSLIIMYLNENTLNIIKSSLNLISSNLNVSVLWLIILITLVFIFECLMVVFCGYAGIIFGYSYDNKKFQKALFFGFSFYILIMIISSGTILISAFFNQDLYNLIFNGTETVDFSLIKVLLIMYIILYGLIDFLMYFISNKKLNKGINID